MIGECFTFLGEFCIHSGETEEKRRSEKVRKICYQLGLAAVDSYQQTSFSLKKTSKYRGKTLWVKQYKPDENSSWVWVISLVTAVLFHCEPHLRNTVRQHIRKRKDLSLKAINWNANPVVLCTCHVCSAQGMYVGLGLKDGSSLPEAHMHIPVVIWGCKCSWEKLALVQGH